MERNALQPLLDTRMRTRIRQVMHSTWLLVIVCFVFVSKAIAMPKSVPVHNALVRGMTSTLENITTYAEQNPCYQARCKLPIPPFELSISSAHTSRLKIIITDVNIQNPTVASGVQTLNLSSQRPILLRGFVRPADTTAYQFVPVAGTIFRDSTEPTLSLVIPIEHLKRKRSSGNFAAIRVPLSELSKTSRNARSSAATAFAFPETACGTKTSPAISAQTRSRQPKSQPVQSLETYNTIYLATDYDTLYPSRAGCSSVSSCNNKIISDVHNASVFYENQLGYAFEVEHQFSSTAYSGTTVSESILDEFSIYNFNNRSQYFDSGSPSGVNQVDIFSLFTGKSMNDGVIGIAYVGTACQDSFSEYASTVVEHRSTTLNPVILAHEVGHSLNADHTASGIMQASLGSPPPSNFSSPSLSTINSYLSSYYDECRQGSSSGAPGAPPVTLGLSVTRLSRRSLMLSVTPSSLESGCSIKLYAAGKKSRLDDSNPIYEFVPSEVTTELSGSVRFKVKTTTNNPKPYIFFKAQYVCSDNEVQEVSAARRYNANRGKRRVKKARSKRRWITTFVASLNQSE